MKGLILARIILFVLMVGLITLGEFVPPLEFVSGVLCGLLITAWCWLDDIKESLKRE